MRSYKAEGIVLKRTNTGEADKILTIFSKNLGKIRVLAKGIRKTTSKKGGNLELFNWVRISLAQGKGLDIVSEAETVKSFRGWRKDLRKVARAYHCCELVDKLTAEGVVSHEVFSLLAEALEDPPSDQDRFARRLLEETGFWPRGKTTENHDFNAYVERIIGKRIATRRVFKDLDSL